MPNHDVVFVMTLPEGSPHTIHILEESRKLGVQGKVVNLGPIPQEGCSEVYRSCNLVILPSQLESFSNSVVEAWTMQKPLLISDMDWARSSCGSGAAYFKYRDPYDAANQIQFIRNNSNYSAALIAEGKLMLSTYPTATERFKEYLSLIERHDSVEAM
jgi:glycosyltransferase involved in cell wall biosynthesis